LGDDVDEGKLEKAVTAKSGIPTYVMPGPDLSPGIPAGVETASAPMPEPPPNATAAVSAAAPVRNAIDFDTPIGSTSTTTVHTDPVHTDYDRAAPNGSTTATHADFDHAAPSNGTTAAHADSAAHADYDRAEPGDDTSNDGSMDGSDSEPPPASGNAASSGLPPAHVVPALPVE
jgi:hypothetical protein